MGDRRAHLKKIQTPEGMAEAYAARLLDRTRDRKYVIGRHELSPHGARLICIEKGPAWNIIRPLQLTEQIHRWYRWGSKQAANQFVHRWNIANVHVWSLDFLDIVPPTGDVHLEHRSTHNVAPPPVELFPVESCTDPGSTGPAPASQTIGPLQRHNFQEEP